MDIRGKKIETKSKGNINPMSSMPVNKQAIKEKSSQNNNQLFVHEAPARCNERSLMKLSAFSLENKAFVTGFV